VVAASSNVQKAVQQDVGLPLTALPRSHSSPDSSTPSVLPHSMPMNRVTAKSSISLLAVTILPSDCSASAVGATAAGRTSLPPTPNVLSRLPSAR
jgi:hypothetical protein